MVALNDLVARARASRIEAVRVRDETARLSHESKSVSSSLAREMRSCSDTVDRTNAVRRDLPTWPAWGWPDATDLRRTLVPLD